MYAFLRLIGLASPLPVFDSSVIKNILIIRLDRIGDLVLSTPAFRAVREHFPKARIVLLVSSYTKDIVQGSPDIDELITMDKNAGILKRLKLIREIGDRRFDLSITLSYCIWSIMTTFFSGAIFKVGIDNYGLGFLFTSRMSYKLKDRGDRHEVETTLDVVRTIGIDTKNKTLYVPVNKSGEIFAETFYKSNRISSEDFIVVVHPGSTDSYKRWMPEGFAAVADYLIRKYNAKVIITGSEKEIILSLKIESLMSNRPVLAAGTAELTQLVSILKRCRLFIGNATGPMHIAASFNIPTIGIFGCLYPIDSPIKWHPWMNLHIGLYRGQRFFQNVPQYRECNALYWKELSTVTDVVEAADAITTRFIIKG